MQIEIDQSGRVEYTSHTTVIADSRGNSILIKTKDKKILQDIYRKANRPRIFAIQVFAALIFLLIKKDVPQKVIIDTEYPGYEDLIRSYLVQFLKSEKIDIYFKPIGKKSKAHETAWKVFRSKRARNVVGFKEILSLVLNLEKS